MTTYCIIGREPARCDRTSERVYMALTFGVGSIRVRWVPRTWLATVFAIKNDQSMPREMWSNEIVRTNRAMFRDKWLSKYYRNVFLVKVPKVAMKCTGMDKLFGEVCGETAAYATPSGPRCERHAEVMRETFRNGNCLLLEALVARGHSMEEARAKALARIWPIQ